MLFASMPIEALKKLAPQIDQWFAELDEENERLRRVIRKLESEERRP